MTSRSPEAFFWSLFAAGGVVAALLMPIIILVFGILAPLEWQWFTTAASYTGVKDLLDPLLIRVIVGFILAMVTIHAVHRIRHLAIDLHLPVPPIVVAGIAYCCALLVTGLAVLYLALI